MAASVFVVVVAAAVVMLGSVSFVKCFSIVARRHHRRRHCCHHHWHRASFVCGSHTKLIYGVANKGMCTQTHTQCDAHAHPNNEIYFKI